MFQEKDYQQFEEKGIPNYLIKQQIESFKRGFPFAKLIAPANYASGIKRMDVVEIEDYIKLYKRESSGKKIMKFVPASGAASRMFKHLFEFREKLDSIGEEAINNMDDESAELIEEFFENIEKFAFFDELAQMLAQDNYNINDLIENSDYETILKYLLDEYYMNYAQLPKALISFHKYEDHIRKAVEEHLVEGANYAVNSDKKVYIHFTVSPNHINLFEYYLQEVLSKYEKEFKVEFEIEYSIQKPETDTMAVDLENNPFRNNDGSILFRPGGHGALIDNLNELNADLVFIKNIDNVSPDNLKQDTYDYKMALAGYLFELQSKIFAYNKIFDNNEFTSKMLIDEIIPFVEDKLMIRLPDYFFNLSVGKQAEYIANKLNRPLRVCGMVENTGEPGGGPFWVESYDDVSLQIVEKSQIDTEDPKQYELLQNATHFNPVDLICALKDYKGTQFNLKEYIDDDTGFISTKSKDGKNLKALELPGLWNGAMADWTTVFVEIPISTFNPVKTINDLFIC
jgi:hypothetical protein